MLHYILKFILLFLKEASPGVSQLPSCYRDHMSSLAAAKTGAGLLIREQGYFFLRNYDTETSKNCI